MQCKTAFDAMLFDCDGVLVDSEPIVNQVLRDRISLVGWNMTVDECTRTFVGSSLEGVRSRIQEHTGVTVGDDWVATFEMQRDAALRTQLRTIPGAVELVQFAHSEFKG